MPAQLAHWLILIAGGVAATIVAPAPNDRQPEPAATQSAPATASDGASTFTPPAADEIEDFAARSPLFFA